MTDRPTNRISRPSDGWGGTDDARTQQAFQQGRSATPPTSKIHRGDSNEPTQVGQVSPQAWSQETGEPGYYRESGGYYPEAQQSNWQSGPDAYSAPPSDADSDADEVAPRSGFRSAPTYLLVAAAVAVLTAGGGLVYTLTASDHLAPAHPSVQPAPKQSNDVAPAPQAPAPDAPISAPGDSSGSASNAAPPPVVVPAPTPQQQTDPNPPLPDNQQQPDPNQQFPNNQVPNNGPFPNNKFPGNQQFPNNQQQPGHHHPPNNQQNQQNQQQPNNQQQQPNNQQQQQPNNQQQQPNRQPESAQDTLCHPKPPPC